MANKSFVQDFVKFVNDAEVLEKEGADSFSEWANSLSATSQQNMLLLFIAEKLWGIERILEHN